jgi:outer membrane protein assembly factor BamD (BamD/ComL family)
MGRAWIRLSAVWVALLAFPASCPAPLIYTPGEGWRYEKAGSEGAWRRGRAKDQLDVAQAAFDKKEYGTSLKAARRVVSAWPLSDYAPQAQYLVGRCEEEKKHDEAAFKAYQKLIERYPKAQNYDEVLLRQMAIANRYLAGQWFKLFNVVPFFSSMDKTIKMYEQVIKNGPYSEVAPQAQLNIGAAHEKKMIAELSEAARAYERAADRYSGQPVGRDALFSAGVAYQKQARTAEYDQSIAAQAIATMTDFTALHPEDKRVAEAQQIVGALKSEQARGSFEIARYYEKRHRLAGARIYYNDVLDKDPNSPQAAFARQRIEAINKRILGTP